MGSAPNSGWPEAGDTTHSVPVMNPQTPYVDQTGPVWSINFHRKYTIAITATRPAKIVRPKYVRSAKVPDSVRLSERRFRTTGPPGRAAASVSGGAGDNGERPSVAATKNAHLER